jgi:hypothetical protein
VPHTVKSQPIMVDLKIHLQRARKKRWATKTKAEKQATASHAGRAYWANLSAEERSAEMKRRAVVRAKNAKRKKKK